MLLLQIAGGNMLPPPPPAQLPGKLPVKAPQLLAHLEPALLRQQRLHVAQLKGQL
jgi:hypothetical protein